jgi:hypothetical protein
MFPLIIFSPREFVSNVPLLDEKMIKCMVVEKKKHELLRKYMSGDLMEYQDKDKEMIDI